MHWDKVRFHCHMMKTSPSDLFPFQNPKTHILRGQRWECQVLGDLGRFTFYLFLSPKAGLCFLSWTEVGIWVPSYIPCCQGAQELCENTLDLSHITRLHGFFNDMGVSPRSPLCCKKRMKSHRVSPWDGKKCIQICKSGEHPAYRIWTSVTSGRDSTWLSPSISQPDLFPPPEDANNH